MTPGAHERTSHWHANAVQHQLVVSGADTLSSRNPRTTNCEPITLHIREAALTRLDGSEIAARLVAGLTDAVASVLGQQTRNGTSVELVATPEGRASLGGAISQ